MKMKKEEKDKKAQEEEEKPEEKISEEERSESSEISEEDNEKSSENSDKNQSKPIIVILIVMGILIAICIGALAFTKSANEIKYAGIEFNRHYLGQIELYTAKVPVFKTVSGISGATIINYLSIDFRNNPKKIKDIPVYVQKIGFVTDKQVYVSYSNLKMCEDNGLAAANFGIFLNEMGLNPKGAMNNESYWNNTAIPYVNCNTHPGNTVILVKNGDETKIEQTSETCYVVTSKDCDILKVLERFELAVLEGYMSAYK